MWEERLLESHPIKQALQNVLFDHKAWALDSLKNPPVSFILQIPHSTKRQSTPHLHCSMLLKPALPALQKVRHRSGITQTIPHNVKT